MQTDLTDLSRRQRIAVFSTGFLLGVSTLFSSNSYIKILGIIILLTLGVIAKISNFMKVTA